MKIAVISDLHLGPAGAADLFGHDDSEFMRFLKFLERNFEKVVLLGDIWETLTGRIPGRPERELGSARESHPEIAQRFSSRQYAYVHGNHDLVAGVVEGAPDELSSACCSRTATRTTRSFAAPAGRPSSEFGWEPGFAALD
jgi:metallophosphoesterase superfamily enzyme